MAPLPLKSAAQSNASYTCPNNPGKLSWSAQFVNHILLNSLLMLPIHRFSRNMSLQMNFYEK
jgi:hypothetical protein